MSSDEQTTVKPRVEMLPEGATRIVLPMTGYYLPTPSWLRNTDLLAIILVPLWLLVTAIIRFCFRIPAPPRVVIDVDIAKTHCVFRQQETGEVSEYTWPSKAISEVRPNRYGPGLWIRVVGLVQDTYLKELPKEAVECIAEELRKALATKRADNALQSYPDTVEHSEPIQSK